MTGAAGGIGSAAVKEFLSHGCLVTALDRRAIDRSTLVSTPEDKRRLHCVKGDLASESSVAAAFASANKTFGPPSILIANAGITDEATHPPIWEIDVEKWDKVNTNNVRGTFLTLKHFLLSAKSYQEEEQTELENLAIVITGSETGKFGQEGHAEYASGKAGLQYGLVRTVKNEIVRLNSKARINAVAPGWVDTPLIGERLDDPKEMWAECQATVALKKISKPEDIARCMAFLASHRAAGNISGECVSVDGGMEGRLLWKERQVLKPKEASDDAVPTPATTTSSSAAPVSPTAAAIAGTLTATASATAATIANATRSIPTSLPLPTRPRRLRISLSIDFDAISGYLGTGHTPQNTLSDYSAGIFSAQVGVPRLLSLFAKHDISSKVTWFIPGHSMETFPSQTQAIVQSGAEIALHGYSHEGAYALTPAQESAILSKCIALSTSLTGKRPLGYRAPLYQIRESTVQLLQSHSFLYDSSMNAHDSLPYLLPHPFPTTPPTVPDYSRDAESWMHPTPLPPPPAPSSEAAARSLVEIPASWYTEDMTPLGFYPYSSNTHGYVAVDAVEKMWWDRFEWLWENESFVDDHNDDGGGGKKKGFGSSFPLIWHPESAGRAHIVGMIDRFVARLRGKVREARAGGGVISFETMEGTARAWRVGMGY